jgi:lipopolysaccharide/colanic/teichoic acid biosynthesis glycosyltransferase
MYPAIALAIRLESPGGVFFKQRRARSLETGSDGKSHLVLFDVLKFRTMCKNAESGTGAVISPENDSRVTRMGRFLRKSRIDEFPQFINILKGEMSLVGPRPERPEILKDLSLAVPYFEERLRDVKPGLTGLAQIKLGYTGAIPEDSELTPFKHDIQNPFGLEEAEGALADDLRAKLLYDMAYLARLETFSTFIVTELEIIVMTPIVMLRGLGR